MKDLTNKKIKEIREEFLENDDFIWHSLTMNLGDNSDYNYFDLIEAGQETINEVVEAIFGDFYNSKCSKYRYYNVQNIKDYCQEWFFDCYHCCDTYSKADIIILIADFINGVLEYPKEDKAFRKFKRGE